MSPHHLHKQQPDCIVSLQNLPVLGTRRPQIVYVHQAIPFGSIRFRFRDSRDLWLRQRVLSPFIIAGCRRADVIVVQSEWMRSAIRSRIKQPRKPIVVIPPDPGLPNHVAAYDPDAANPVRFIYPAGPLTYKNHRVLVEAAGQLVATGSAGSLELVLTVTKSDLSDLGLREMPEGVVACRLQSRDWVLEQLSRSILVFPFRPRDCRTTSSRSERVGCTNTGG